MAQRRTAALANSDPEYLQRRADLVKAAAAIFRSKGFRGTRLKDVAEAIGLDRATVYYYISGKDELFQIIIAEGVQHMVDEAEKLVTLDDTADRRIGLLIDTMMRGYEEHYPFLYVYVQEDMAKLSDAGAWSKQMKVLGRRFDKAVRSIVEQGIAEGSIAAKPDEAALVANAVIGMCNWTHRWFKPKSPGDAAAIASVFSKLVLKGLTPRR